MKIYTRGGDEGFTGLFGGERVPKDHLRIQTYGTLDETNALLGCSVSLLLGAQPETVERLKRVQSELLQLGAELATPRNKEIKMKLIDEGAVSRLEKEIDEMEAKLKPLQSFILPGGSLPAAQLHCARTVCRRAERDLTILHRAEPVRPVVLQYVNRLSDYFFVTARFVNHLLKVEDIPWIAPKS